MCYWYKSVMSYDCGLRTWKWKRLSKCDAHLHCEQEAEPAHQRAIIGGPGARPDAFFTMCEMANKPCPQCQKNTDCWRHAGFRWAPKMSDGEFHKGGWERRHGRRLNEGTPPEKRTRKHNLKETFPHGKIPDGEDYAHFNPKTIHPRDEDIPSGKKCRKTIMVFEDPGYPVPWFVEETESKMSLAPKVV